MNDILELIFKSPIANLLIIAGLVFLGIAVVGNVSGKIQPGIGGRFLSGLLGLCLLGGGLVMYQSTPLEIDPLPSPNVTSPSNPSSEPDSEQPVTLTSNDEPVSEQELAAPPTLTSVPPLPNEEYVDTETQEQGMHACPVGFAIAGV